ncbi:11540_t:CDS:2, partial [Funneliformis geosporum]
ICPDIHVGFNDSDYDWCFIMERAYHLNILEWMWKRMTGKFETKEKILKWKYREKIGAKSENDFVKKHPVKAPEEGEEDLEEKEYMGSPIRIKISVEDYFTSSFLKLPGCIPIDVQVCLKKRFPHSEVEKEGSLKFFLQKFGLDNALCCQELLVNQSIINDYREVASIAYVSLFDTHYRANGMKVRNLPSACAIKRDMVISTRLSKDIEKGKYPGAYVFPPKKGIITERPADNICKNGNELHTIEDLSNKRLELKARLAPLGKKKQYLGKMISSAKKRGKRVSESLNSEYSSVCFDYDYWDSKQKALKVYMNTFYGEAGNSKSPIFLRELACGTTTAGKYNLNLVTEFVSKKGFG